MSVEVINLNAPSSYSSGDENLLSPSTLQTSFNPSTDYIEYVISTPDNSFQTIDYGYIQYSIPDGVTSTQPTSDNLNELDIDPTGDLSSRGYSAGEFNTYYNFLRNELNSSYGNQIFFIKEISSDRTEVILRNISPSPQLIDQVNTFKSSITSGQYYQDFYLNFGNNILIVANNIAIDPNTYDISVNLYSTLPSNIDVNNTLWVVTKVADTLAFNITYTPTVVTPSVTTFPLKGPNLNLPIKDEVNNTTDYTTFDILLTSSLLSTQYSQLNNLISSSEIEINVDYTDFSNFVHFSSAEKRLRNFYYKVGLIEQYSASISTINTSYSGYDTASNITIYTNQINNIIQNFDGYEYYLYYSSGSWAWPKSNSTIPYVLYSTSSATVENWFDGIIISASIYDENNPDYLYYSIPAYLRDDSTNDPYKVFVDMVGQHYDNIWIYYKDVTNLHVADNRLDYGISKDLVAEALKSFGIKLYQNNFSTNDLYSAFLGYGNPNPEITGSTPVTSNSFQEYISDYITSSYDASVMPLDDVNKEVYKRLYHNLPYLSKTKGTIPGLRALINCFGIPDTILRISEFGGRDKDTSTYDYFYNRYSYAFTGHSGSDSRAYPQIPWAPLSTTITSSGDGVGYVALQYVLEDYVYREGGGGGTTPSASLPSNIEFRFKTNGIPSNHNTQSLLIKTNTSQSSAIDDWNIGIFLSYDQPLTPESPYYDGTGSIASETPTQGNLYFILQSSTNYLQSTNIQLPFFDEGWWSVMLQRDKPSLPGEGNDEVVTYTLYTANKLYDSEEGNIIGFVGSSSITVDGAFYPDLNEAWNNFNLPAEFTPYEAGIYLGGHYSGSNFIGDIYVTSASFDGYFQEFRYYSLPLDIKTFEDYTMNPTSIEGLQLTGVSSSFNILGFRAALGNELWWRDFEGLPEYESPFISTNNNATDDYQRANSIHPAIYANNILITQSFYNPNNNTLFSDYALLYPYNSNANTPEKFYTEQTEVYYFDQPIIGIKNRVTDKIQIVSSSYPTGSVLSQYTSLEQSYPSLGSESPDVNLLEVAFSPQNEINDDILSSLGYFNIGEYIGDPRQISSSATTYPDLVNLSNDFFKKYFDTYNLFDYIRLIKYFDNSLFKMIQDFVPARTSLTSGIVIKQHLLERNKYPQPQVEWEFEDYSGSIETAFISGSTGGTFNQYNILTSNQTYPFIISGSGFIVDPETPINYFLESSSFSTITTDNSINNNFSWDENTGELITYFYGEIKLFASGTNSPAGNTFILYFSSSQNDTIATSTQGSSTWSYITPVISCSYGEKFSLWIADGGSGPNTISVQFGLYDVYPYSEQTWPQYYTGSTGISTIIHSTQDEFYNGELPGTEFIVTTGELNDANDFKYPSTTQNLYTSILYLSNITPLEDFLNINTSPNQGEIYLWFDTGSTLNPTGPGVPTGGGGSAG